jgi:hypothetical protein
MLDALAARYTRISMNAHRYAYAEHVPDRPVGAVRIADFIAVDSWRGPWHREMPTDDEWGYPIHGHEVKVSRSDWLTELKQPDKAESFKPYVDYWWLCVSHPSIVKDGELPDGWGLMVLTGDRMRAKVRAPRLSPEPMPKVMNVALMRAIAKTARRAS